MSKDAQFNPKEVDAETQKLQRDGQELKNMVQSDGWKIARGRLVERMANLMNIASVDVMQADPATIVQVIGARKLAADELISFLRDIEGSVEQFEGNKEMMKSIEEVYIYRQSNN